MHALLALLLTASAQAGALAPSPSAPRVMVCNAGNELVKAVHAGSADATYWPSGKEQTGVPGNGSQLLQTMLEGLALSSSTGIFNTRLEPVPARQILIELERGVAFRAGAEGCLEVFTGPAARELVTDSGPEPEAR